MCFNRLDINLLLEVIVDWEVWWVEEGFFRFVIIEVEMLR